MIAKLLTISQSQYQFVCLHLIHSMWTTWFYFLCRDYILRPHPFHFINSDRNNIFAAARQAMESAVRCIFGAEVANASWLYFLHYCNAAGGLDPIISADGDNSGQEYKIKVSIYYSHFKCQSLLSATPLLFRWTKCRTYIFTAGKRSCEKVMFSQVSVCHSVQRRSPCDHYPVSPSPLTSTSPSPLLYPVTLSMT